MVLNRFVLITGPLMCLIVLTDCAVGPRSVRRDRINYTSAIGNSRDSQVLLAIVRLRYLELPTFLSVQQVVAGYNRELSGQAGVGLSNLFGKVAGGADVGASGKLVERPTITYSPLEGAQFVNSLLMPVSLEVLLGLLQSSWDVDILFDLIVRSINGKSNRSLDFTGGTEAESEFERTVTLFRKLHDARAFGVRFQAGENEIRELTIRTARLSPELRNELAEVKGMLGLDPAENTFKLVYDVVAEDSRTLAIQTRPLLQILRALSEYVEVPTEDLESGVAGRIELSPDRSGSLSKLRIRSGRNVPVTALAHVRHNGHSFWIDSRDSDSKRIFVYLSLLLTITESSPRDAPPLVITTN